MKNTSGSFAPLAKAYRRWRAVSTGAAASCFAVLWVTGVLKNYLPAALRPDRLPIFGIAVLLAVVVMVSALAAEARFKCSQCKVSLQTTEFLRCQACGGRSLFERRRSEPHHCSNCGLQLHTGKGRRVLRVYSCNHCGAYHEEGP